MCTFCGNKRSSKKHHEKMRVKFESEGFYKNRIWCNCPDCRKNREIKKQYKINE